MIPFKIDATVFLYIVFILGSAISLVLGVLSWARTAALLLPLPAWVPAVATLIYPITALTLILTRLFTTPSNDDTLHNRRWNTIFSIISQMQSVISTIAATVALAYLFPDRILSCNLEQQWQGFFHSKKSKAIRSIQDELRCCGLRSLHDRAWPFKDRNHGDNACELQLGYRRSCFAPWKEQQQKTSWMIFAAVIFGFAAKFAFVQLSRQRKSWIGAQSGGRWPGYQVISHPEVQDEEENEHDVHERVPRTFLPQSNAQSQNDWRED